MSKHMSIVVVTDATVNGKRFQPCTQNCCGDKMVKRWEILFLVIIVVKYPIKTGVNQS